MTVERHLSRRERQILDALFTAGEATAHDVLAAIPDPPSYSAVRAHLARLMEKGIVGYRQDGIRYVYFPAVEKQNAQDRALRRVVKTFFNGSVFDTVSALLGSAEKPLETDEMKRLERLLQQAKKQRADRRPDEKPGRKD